MNRICKLFLTIFNLVFVGVYGQNNLPNEPYLIDDFDYITQSTASIVAPRNFVKGADFEGFSSIYNGEAGTNSVYKINGGLYFNPSPNNSATLISQDLEFQGTGNSIEKYYWRFSFSIKGRNGNQSTPKVNITYHDGTSEPFTLNVASGNNYTVHDLELYLGEKNIKNFEITAELGFNGFDLDKIAIYTDAPTSTTTTFNGIAWSKGQPDINTDAVFNGNFIFNESLTAKSLKVVNGSNITVKSGNNITLKSSLNVENDANLKFQQSAYLIQYDPNAVNTGNVSFLRSTKPMYRYNTNTWSSPVVDQNLFAFSPNTITSRFYNYDTSTDLWLNTGINSQSTFFPGKGYGIYAPNNFPNYNNGTNQPMIFTGEYVGVPNNGNVEVPIVLSERGNKQYLLGNPYPSPISLLGFIDMYYREVDVVSLYTHEVPVDNYLGVYASDKSHYITINNLGQSNPDLDLESYRIDVGQAFFVKLSSEQIRNFKFIFTNYYLRFDDEGFYNHNETPIYYRNNRKVEDKFWLTLRKDNEKIGNALIGFSDISTDDFDAKYDTKGIDASTKSGIFSQLNSEDYILQSFSTFSDDKKVLLSFRTPELGVYNIDLAKVKGLFEDQKIYLKDNFLNTFIDLNENQTYQFTAEKGLNNDRFEIHFKENLVANDLTNSQVKIYTENSDLHIKLDSNVKASYKIYDSLGRLVSNDDFIQNAHIPNLNSGIYIVIVDDSVQKLTKKIIIK